MTNSTKPNNRPLGHRQEAYLALASRPGGVSIPDARSHTGLDRHRASRGYRPMHTLWKRGLVKPTAEKTLTHATIWVAA